MFVNFNSIGFMIHDSKNSHTILNSCCYLITMVTKISLIPFVAIGGFWGSMVGLVGKERMPTTFRAIFAPIFVTGENCLYGFSLVLCNFCILRELLFLIC